MVLGALGLWLMLNVEIFHDEDCDPCIPVLVDFQVLKQQSEHGRRQGVSERRIVLKQFLADMLGQLCLDDTETLWKRRNSFFSVD